MHSRTWTFFDDAWHEGNVPIMGPRTHGAWLGSTVFDGARAFEGVAPDLEHHCRRINVSAAGLRIEAGRGARNAGWTWPRRASPGSAPSRSSTSAPCTGPKRATAAA